jgi:uncharacterized protein (TIGR02271 family)
MTTQHDVRTWRGRTVVDRDGDKIGKVEDVYLDRRSDEPEWLAVKTGLFGSNVSFVPVQNATMDDDAIRVEHEKELVKDAPNIDPDGELSPDEERRLYDHYGRSDYDDWAADSGERTEIADASDHTRPSAGDGGADDGRSEAADVAPDTRTEDAMTRSEDELHVATQRRESGRARLRKYVDTETVEETVPLRREELRVEREPITDANRDAALAGSEITEAEHEVTLYTEEPVVEKRTVPKERVRLEKDVHTDEETISEDVRRERIDTEGDVGRDDAR